MQHILKTNTTKTSYADYTGLLTFGNIASQRLLITGNTRLGPAQETSLTSFRFRKDDNSGYRANRIRATHDPDK